jgi:DNA-binding transcriptional MerR regulator
MTIRDAAALTGLTRKAIKYYETEGLVRPRVDPENGYRAYGEEEIIRLNLIAALRDLGVPVREIRALVAGEKDLARVLHATLAALEARLKQLEASAAVVRELLAQEPADLGELSARVRHLRETLVSTEARAEAPS